MTPQTNTKFKELIPALSPDEYEQLEINLQTNGCNDSIKLWNGVIIDGHNRFEICTRLSISYTTEDFQFNNESDVVEWMINNQLGRRNLNDYNRGILALMLKPVYEARAKENMSEAARLGNISQPSVDTGKELSKIACISDRQLDKIEYIQEHGWPEMKRQLSEGIKWSISSAFNELKEKRDTYETSLARARLKDCRATIRAEAEHGLAGIYYENYVKLEKEGQERYDRVMGTQTGEILNSLSTHLQALPMQEQKDALNMIFEDWIFRMRDAFNSQNKK